MRKKMRESINVLAKHGITHDMRIKTTVVYGIPSWAFTFLRGARGEEARAWEKKLGLGRRRYFWCVYLHSWSIFVQPRRKRRFEESSGKKTLTPSLIILDLGKNPNLM